MPRIQALARAALAIVFSSSLNVVRAQAPAAAPAPTSLDSVTLAGFRWRNVGPANFGGRVADIAAIPSPSKTFYVATAGGGIWKTTNAGTTFRSIFESQRVVSMGALAIAPSDTSQVWAGTGEQNSRNTIEPGMGLYKSADGGKTWKLMGLEKTQHIGRIVVHPTNPNIVYVAALGAAWKANPERGLYKTEDGGVTWKLIKFIDDSTGFVDVAMDPSNPNVLFASAYQRVRGPYFLTSGGKGSGLWKTTDGGATWAEVKGGGFPETTKGRIGISISRSNPNVIYTLVEADTLPNAKPAPAAKAQAKSGLYRSDDGGQTWAYKNDQDTRPFYYSQVRVDPKNPDRVYWSSTPILFSDDGGKTARTATGGVHVDHHAMWIDPNDPEHFIVGNDGGIAQTWDRGGNFVSSTVLPVGQFYAVSFDYAVPYNICGGAQDNGSWCGPSRRRNGGVSNAYWFTYSGGDGFWTAQDPSNPKIIYGESQGGFIQRWDLGTGDVRGVFPPSYRPRYRQYEDSIIIARGDTTQSEPRDVRNHISDLRTRQKADSVAMTARFNWETPFFLSPHNKDVVYIGGNHVFKSTQRGDNVYSISPDLSKQDAKKIDISMNKTGGITLDATGAETYGTVVALAESPVKPGFLYAGTDDGNVWYTTNDGAAWTQVDWRKFPGLPNNEVYVSRVEPSHFDTLTWYVSFDNHRTNDFTPYLYATTDGGNSFKSLAATLPTGGPDYVRVVREDPYNRDLLFAGTSVGAYVSIDRGGHWQKFMTGMPTVPVFDLKIHPRDRELIAATHGRDFFIVDIAPLEQMAGKQIADVTLFEPKRAWQFGEAPRMAASGNGDGQYTYTSPPAQYGAEIVYRIAPGATAGPILAGSPASPPASATPPVSASPPSAGPATPASGTTPPRPPPPAQVKVVIQDASGDTIATLNGPGSSGLQRVVWGFNGSRRLATVPPLGPADLRDSIVRARKTTAILDSLEKAGWDSTLVRQGRQLLLGPGGPTAPQMSINCGGGGGPGSSPDRPAEGGVVRSGSAGCTMTVGGVNVDFDKYQEAQRLINRAINGPNPNAGGNVFFFGGGPGNRGTTGFQASTGDYLVSITVGGKTYKQILHVDRVAPGELRY
jgi:photosystem II stability/assembly factor-like uncharacterized protein